MSDTTQSLTET